MNATKNCNRNWPAGTNGAAITPLMSRGRRSWRRFSRTSAMRLWRTTGVPIDPVAGETDLGTPEPVVG